MEVITISNLFLKNLNEKIKKIINKNKATLSLVRNIIVALGIKIKNVLSIFLINLKSNRIIKLMINGSNLTIKLPNFFHHQKNQLKNKLGLY